MIHPILDRKLREIVAARREVRLNAGASVLLMGCALCLVLAWFAGFQISALWLLAVMGLGAGIVYLWAGRGMPDAMQLARAIEEKHPELDSLIRTAIAVEPGPQGLSYLQEQVLNEATRAAVRQAWANDLTAGQAKRSKGLLIISLVAFVIAGANSLVSYRRTSSPAETARKTPVQAEEKALQFELLVTPGDAEVEKGSRLIVEAKFAKDVPEGATIIVRDDKGVEKQLPMRLTVDQQVFGGMIAGIDRDSQYRVEFGSGKSENYKITTFVHPALERSDAKVTPPEHTGLPVKEIRNTLKVSAMEGSEVAFQFRVNKPIAEAELFGEDKSIIPLKARTDDPTILEAAMKPEKSQRYRLHLVDEKERSNKQPPWVTVNVQANQLPKIEVAFPKRDVQVSSIQELPVEAKVWDDLGVKRSGAVFSLAGKSREIMLSSQPLEAAKKHDLKALYELEPESAEPRQLVSYYFWAEDHGPKGEVRRAMSDMFFADVRHFEDIFRETEAPPSEPGPPKKGEADKLVDLQKQVVNANWRLVRDTQAGRKIEDAVADVEVVRQSQEIALNQVKEAMEKVEDVEIKAALTEAWKSMKDALTPLEQVIEEKKRGPLTQALSYEQSALEWLYRTASREHQVTRQNKPQKGAGGQQKNEQQLMNLELKQKEQRYEEEKQATPEQTAEQQENLLVLNRLKELARRQEALAAKMKELEKQIEKAKTEEEKEELANQLKRLQEEQEQLLRDVDDLKEKMDQSENQATFAEAKEELEKTREQVLDAAEKLKEDKLAQAANSATRAQRELEEMQENFRKKTSRRFTDEMKQMKQQAAEAAAEQKKIAEVLENQKSNDIPGDTSNAIERVLNGSETARQIEKQTERVEKLMEEMRRVSEQAETAEPLLSQGLYDAVRKAHTSGLEENLDETRQYARMGERSLAQDSERKATKAVEDLQKGVEKAAERILGSEGDALRMARAELDSLIEDMKFDEGKTKGGAAGEPEKPGAGKTEKGDPTNETAKAEQSGSGEKRESGKEPGEKGKPAQDGKTADTPPEGETGKDGESKGKGKGEKPGDEPGKAGSSSPSETAQSGQGESPMPGKEPANGEGKAGGKPSEGSPQQAGTGDPKPTEPGQSQQASSGSTSGRSQGQKPSGDGKPSSGGGGGEGGLFFDAPEQQEDTSALTGNGFQNWSDRLRSVEELLNRPELRNEAARVIDNARALRLDAQKRGETPKSDYVQMRITNPLVELRDRVAEELAKREGGNSLAPVDRDPVPQQFRDLVRKYYQELGEGK